jgi:hypothetical protein
MPMNMQIAPICEADVEEVSRFLRATFGCDERWVPFQPEVLRWKALTPHPLWEGSRGYAMRKQGEIVAYGCAAPIRLIHAGGEALVACLIDWTASKEVVGGGVLVYQHIARFVDALIGVGGTDEARRTVQRMGFRTRQNLDTYARVTRPVIKFLETREKRWKDVARMARNIWRGFRTTGGSKRGWVARRVERFDESVSTVLPIPGLVSGAVAYRDPKLLNYYLSCPAIPMEGYLLEHAGRVQGYLLLAVRQGDCRIADWWVASADESDWAAALLVACNGRTGHEVSVSCGTFHSQRVAKGAGFYLSVRHPFYVKDPGQKVPATLDAAIAMADTDEFYL